ncbi:MAG: hypothetical protein IJH84_18740 [Saccharopolyspora sp.]|uniref:hypothetical protein n=1 Tax=Saccharopolyspora sp. TaxID=33915 RepID=UPI0025F7E753|nr:hypothetical protein [Saccharopolyspora sp.]MBQ6643054.1 hypothetical protein [Saccharopolyspora sp.]
MDDKIARLEHGAPQREWLCRCVDDDERFNIATVGAASGDVEIAGPELQGCFRLRDSEIAVFRRALDEAIAVAQEDIARYDAQAATQRAEQEPDVHTSNR